MLRLKLSNLIETSNDIVLIIDSAGQINIVNERAVKMLGYTREELRGRTIESFVTDGSWEDVQK
jgi:PAS domain S-box-containing protein